MAWLPRRRRELGSVEAIMVQVHGPGRRVGRRTVRPGRVILTYEDGYGRVIVESDIDSMAAMLERALVDVHNLRTRRRDLLLQILAGTSRPALPPDQDDTRPAPQLPPGGTTPLS